MANDGEAEGPLIGSRQPTFAIACVLRDLGLFVWCLRSHCVRYGFPAALFAAIAPPQSDPGLARSG